MTFKCKGCIRRREQLRQAKEKVLSLIPGYKGVMPTYPPKWRASDANPYNLTVDEINQLKSGNLVYNEGADESSIKYLGMVYKMSWLQYQHNMRQSKK